MVESLISCNGRKYHSPACVLLASTRDGYFHGQINTSNILYLCIYTYINGLMHSLAVSLISTNDVLSLWLSRCLGMRSDRIEIRSSNWQICGWHSTRNIRSISIIQSFFYGSIMSTRPSFRALSRKIIKTFIGWFCQKHADQIHHPHEAAPTLTLLRTHH